MNTNMKRIYDPLYGVTLLSDFEYKIISSPEIQRLRYVRLCNINSMLVTGASEISRFEHILGVLRLAKEWIDQNGAELTSRERDEFCAAALMHDFQTGPFGHSMQYVFEDNETEDNFIHDNINHGAYRKFHQSTDASASFCGRPFSCESLLGKSWYSVAELIQGEGNLGQLISGTVDIDNIDNVIRLAYHVGVASSQDANVAIALARDITPNKHGLEISSSSLGMLVRWQEIRRRLYELLLLDWAEFSAKAMLTRAMELAFEHELLGTDSWLRTDLELFSHLEKESTGEGQEIGYLIKRIRCGDLYDPLYLGRSISTEKYEKFSASKSKKLLENKLIRVIREKLNMNVNLIVHPILDKKKTDRAVEVVTRENGENLKIGKDSNQLLIGVFLAKPIDSIDRLQKVVKLTYDFLVSEGLEKLTDLEDPMGTTNAKQLDLL